MPLASKSSHSQRKRVTIRKYPSFTQSMAITRLQEGHRSSSGGYAESPPDLRGWTEEERRRRRKTFSLDFLGSGAGVERSADSYGDSVELSPTPSHRHRPRGKSTSARSPHKNNRKRDATISVQQSAQQQAQQQQQQQISRSPQKEDWRVEQGEDGGHVPTSDDSSCSHHYHMHHHHHHHLHREGADGRHRRTRESPRRKTTGYVSTRRRSNEVIFEYLFIFSILFIFAMVHFILYIERKILSYCEILICISKILEQDTCETVMYKYIFSNS